MTLFKNIIFDLGGVILNIDYKKTIDAFRKLGIQEAELIYSKAAQSSLFDKLEMGLISETDFYIGVRLVSKKNVSDNQIRDAWNSLLIGLPDENIQLLKSLKKDHRLFLLSNTNIIHEKAYRELIIKQYGYFIFDDLFEKMYLSHNIHLRKPGTEIFEFVLSDSHLNKSETCFIDDSPQHIDGAESIGLTSFLLIDQGVVDFCKGNKHINRL